MIKGQRLAVLIAAALQLTGCGNQMFRQASYAPLDTPRALPPAQSIPVPLSKAPEDASIVVTPAFGNSGADDIGPVPEPDLPPPNLSDNARNEKAPAAVNAIRPPFSLDSAQLIHSGNTLFLNRCVQCHDAGGYGYGVVGSYLVPHPPDLSSDLVQRNSDGAIFWHISMGQGKMPGFKTWTSPVERWALTAYVRSLKNARPSGTKLLTAHITDTSGSPYPVYGERGFEQGKNTAPFKVFGGAPSPASSKVYPDSTQPHELINAVPN
jgi:mono/diheme cytochrome c family protein